MQCKSLCVSVCVSLSLFRFLRLCVLVPQMMPLFVCGCVFVYLWCLCISVHLSTACLHACIHACKPVDTDMHRHTLHSKNCCQQTPMPVNVAMGKSLSTPMRLPFAIACRGLHTDTHPYFRMHLSCMPICQYRDLQPRDCRISTGCEHLYAYYLVHPGAFHTSTP